jgi:hypothetical protein
MVTGKNIKVWKSHAKSLHNLLAALGLVLPTMVLAGLQQCGLLHLLPYIVSGARLPTASKTTHDKKT